MLDASALPRPSDLSGYRSEQNILPSDYYTSHLLVSRADQNVLRDLVDRCLPNLAEHLEEQGVELSAITFGWFLSLFTDCLPIQVSWASRTCQRRTFELIWDVPLHCRHCCTFPLTSGPDPTEADLPRPPLFDTLAAASGTSSSSTGLFSCSESRSRSSSCTRRTCSSAILPQGCTPCSVRSRLDCGTRTGCSRCATESVTAASLPVQAELLTFCSLAGL